MIWVKSTEMQTVETVCAVITDHHALEGTGELLRRRVPTIVNCRHQGATGASCRSWVWTVNSLNSEYVWELRNIRSPHFVST